MTLLSCVSIPQAEVDLAKLIAGSCEFTKLAEAGNSLIAVLSNDSSLDDVVKAIVEL